MLLAAMRLDFKTIGRYYETLQLHKNSYAPYNWQPHFASWKAAIISMLPFVYHQKNSLPNTVE